MRYAVDLSARPDRIIRERYIMEIDTLTLTLTNPNDIGGNRLSMKLLLPRKIPSLLEGNSTQIRMLSPTTIFNQPNYKTITKPDHA